MPESKDRRRERWREDGWSVQNRDGKESGSQRAAGRPLRHMAATTAGVGQVLLLLHLHREAKMAPAAIFLHRFSRE